MTHCWTAIVQSESAIGIIVIWNMIQGTEVRTRDYDEFSGLAAHS